MVIVWAHVGGILRDKKVIVLAKLGGIMRDKIRWLTRRQYGQK